MVYFSDHEMVRLVYLCYPESRYFLYIVFRFPLVIQCGSHRIGLPNLIGLPIADITSLLLYSGLHNPNLFELKFSLSHTVKLGYATL